MEADQTDYDAIEAAAARGSARATSRTTASQASG
jgi:hypothetical protein